MFFFGNGSSSNKTDSANAGPSISTTALGRVYGWFMEQLRVLHPAMNIQQLIEKYPHPVMCVIGCESTGKSATIESISKVPIFPSDTGICTRCPIKVILQPTERGAPNRYELSYKSQPNQVYNDSTLNEMKDKIAEIFIAVKDDPQNKQGYSAEEINIIVARSDVIRMDFVDLPGIVSYPPEAKAITMSMSQRYISDPNCFIICVANATTPRLTSYEPIACITAANACERTIIVLPMADKLSPRDFQSHLLDRVAMTSDELKGHKFSACCAVVNRSNVSDCSLVQQAERERAWFQTNIVSIVEQGIAKSAPKDRPVLQHTLDTIRARMGIDKLLRVTNQKYEEYIKTRWMPGKLEEIKQEIKSLEAQRAALGVVPSAENLNQFKEYYGNNIHNHFWQVFIANMQLGAVTEDELLLGNHAAAAEAMWTKMTDKLSTELTAMLPTIAAKIGSTYDAVPMRWVRFESAYIPCVVAALDKFRSTTVRAHFLALYSSLLLERVQKGSAPSWIALLQILAPAAKQACTSAIWIEKALVEGKEVRSNRAAITHKIGVYEGVKQNFERKVLAMDHGEEDEDDDVMEVQNATPKRRMVKGTRTSPVKV